MTDLTPTFNQVLRQHGAATAPRSFSVDRLNDFLKEAYKINDHIVSLHAELKNIRQSYLSTAQPRKTLIRTAANSKEPAPLTDPEREKIDDDAKKMLRTLNASIKQLEDSERVRHETAVAVTRRKFRGGLRGWVAGDAHGRGSSRSPEHAAAEEEEESVATFRESVLWLLRQRLQSCVRTQQDMMEVRLSRVMEKNRSVLAKASGRSGAAPDLSSLKAALEPGDSSSVGGVTQTSTVQGLPPGEDEGRPAFNPAQGLTPEQIQLFEQDNQSMLKHYESTLDQVRTAQRSLVEISELQTQLVDNLTTQSEHIEQLVTDSVNTTENVGGGNKQLKKAAQKPSTAKYTFYATCGLCAFLVVWDLVI